jgi:hypothetical protein
MTRSASFRITGNDQPDPEFEGTVRQLTNIASNLAQLGRDSFLNVTTDVEYDEHPERDALLALADKWRESSRGRAESAFRDCADELTRLLATLSH